MGYLSNLKLLKDDMVAKGWSICDFLFCYKGIEYIVLVKRFVGAEKRIDPYALVKLHFLKYDNIQDSLEVEANCGGLLVDAKALREYFGITYSKNLGDILAQFSENLGNSIPKKMRDTLNISDKEKTALVYSLSKSDSEDPNKIYCTGLRRNPSGQVRSAYNADKTKLLRRGLYEKFANDKSISFCYSTDSAKEKGDAAICQAFSNK
ncbi:MAG TPA: hypothetical protein IAB79_09255 [Candidatus Faecousia excrementipullorum]|nr:hypothetical protein [Candidatus Faecousia excrementipullorum]